MVNGNHSLSMTGEFVKNCSQILEANLGQSSVGIIDKVKSKKNLNGTSNVSDFNEFIYLIGLNVSMLDGKNKAIDICDALMVKAEEIVGERKLPGSSIISEIDKEINIFLIRNSLLTENDITEYAKYLALKYSGNKKIGKDLIKKVKIHIKGAINRKKIKEEINRFLKKYPQPKQTDVDDFIHYIYLLKLKHREDELRHQIEKERLIRKFRELDELQNAEETSKIDPFIEFIKTNKDKKDISRALQKQELSCLINHEPEISDDLLSEDFGIKESNHPIVLCDEKLKTLTDNTGGILGRISNGKLKEISNELPKKSIEDGKSFESKVKDALDYFFEIKGIPAESDINDIWEYLIPYRHKQDEKQLIETLKQFSKEKVVLAMNDNVIINEIISFIYRHPSYTRLDVENFIYYMKEKKFDVDDEDIKDTIERERFFIKFNPMNRKESVEEKISRQYIALFNSDKKDNYKYILEHDEKLIQLKLQLKLARILKKPKKHRKIGSNQEHL